MWILYATFAMFCFAGMQLLFKQLTGMGLDPAVILAFVFGFGTLLYLAHSTATGASLTVSARALGFIALASILSYAGNLYMVRSIGAAPNPGYAMAIVGAQAVVVTLAAILLFGSALSWLKALGVLLSVAGVGLLALGA
jgi:drug/metabolite transporter (DMT)-like permease